MITRYVIVLVELIAFLKLLNIIVLARNNLLTPQDVFDLRPFGREHEKLKEIAGGMARWKGRIVLFQVYLHQILLLLLMAVMTLAVIWLFRNRF